MAEIGYISFRGLPSNKPVTQNSTNVFCYSSGGRKSKTKALVGPHLPLQALGKKLSLSFCWLPVAAGNLGVYLVSSGRLPYHSSLCLALHTLSMCLSMCLISLCLTPIRTLATRLQSNRIIHDDILILKSLITSAKTLFLNKISFTGSADSVQFSSVTQLCLTPWTAAHQASLSITNSQSLLKFTSIKSVMPSNHLILCCPLLLLPSIFPSIRVFSNESVLHIR